MENFSSEHLMGNSEETIQSTVSRNLDIPGHRVRDDVRFQFIPVGSLYQHSGSESGLVGSF